MATVLADGTEPRTREVFGAYEAIKGKLSPYDAREAYVLGPNVYGRTAPLASFWRWEEAVQWAKDRHATWVARSEAGIPPVLMLPMEAADDAALRCRLIREYEELVRSATTSEGAGDW